MKYQFKNGATVEGTLEEILKVAKAFNEKPDFNKISGIEDAIPDGFYLSSKFELVELKTMNPMHLRNALLKRTLTYVDKMKANKDIDDTTFLNTYVGLTEDKVVSALFTELASR